METEGSSPRLQEPATCPYPEPDQSSLCPQRFIASFTRARHLSLSWARSIQSMLASHYLKIRLKINLPSTSGSWKFASFPQISPPKPSMHLSSPPHVPYAPNISLFLILSSKQILVSSTDHKAPC